MKTTSASTSPTPTGPAFGAALTAVQFAAALHEPDTTIVDVRTPAEFAEDHLPGSVNVPIAGNFRDAMASRDKARSYALYCQTGNRSAQALQVMKELGFTRAYHLAGGIVSWRQAGGQVTP
ncbi:MAG: rhodanese-like domain-containing protein [Dermatophilaceae bacterium]